MEETEIMPPSEVCDPAAEVWPLSWLSEDSSRTWIPFSYTHVEYIKGDSGWFSLKFVKLTKFAFAFF